MNAMQTAANIIKNEAIEVLAKKHNTTTFIIINTLMQNASESLAKQFHELVTLGVQKAVEMHGEGLISLK